MKLKVLLVICLFVWIPNSNGQKLMAFLDSVERSFVRLNQLTTSLSCDLKFDRRVNEFGIAYYINSEDTRVDVSFFDVFKLPFYNEFQTDLGTTNAFTNWIKYINPDITDSEVSTIQENIDSCYTVLRLSDGAAEKMQIISRKDKIFYCISMTSKELSCEKQINYLKFYLKINKQFHND